MDRLRHILILVLICTNFDGIYSQLSVEEAHELLKTFHDECHKLFPVDEALLDEANLGRFTDDKDLKCYINCMFESIRFLKRGKFNAEVVSKYIKIYAPVQFQEEFLRGVEACKNVLGGGDYCERAFTLAKCFSQNNDHFMIP